MCDISAGNPDDGYGGATVEEQKGEVQDENIMTSQGLNPWDLLSIEPCRKIYRGVSGGGYWRLGFSGGGY
ncbi:hypothetical protein L2E82_45565 [Cichorium intybus]|uniref:Uncharacterized protein n=1 Tax=Cichorium intybus TaxID=13427 RepID=A0ACB8ZT99_CICIN|nr:hypothetical protein L2E82_45565 [Cichorium intybus]